jgi:hypothetical protein
VWSLAGVRAGPIEQFLINFFENCFGTGQDLVVPEPDNHDSQPFELRGSTLIIQGSSIVIMFSTIQLYSQACLFAIEVEDEALDGMLPTKFEAPDVSIPEQKPEQILCIGLMHPERSGKFQDILSQPRIHRSKLPHPDPLPEERESLFKVRWV